MKYKNTAVIFSFVLIFSIFNMGFVPAPSHPSYICEGEGVYDFISDEGCKNTEEIWENIEPPTFFGGFSHKVKMAFSSPETKLKLSAVLTSQQIAQLEEALAEGDYKKAETASEEIRQTLEKSGRWLEEFNGEGVNYDEFYRGDDEFNDFLYTERMYVQDIEKLNEIKTTILEKVDSGETTHVAVDNIFKNIDDRGRVIAKFEEKENEFVDKVAEEGGITALEVKYEINNEDKETGMYENYYKNYDSADYAATMGNLDALRNEIADSDRIYSREVENLFDEAQLRAQLAQTELQNEHYSEAYSEFYKSQYIMNNLENYAEEGERALNEIDESVAVGPAELTKEIVEKNNQMIRDYELARNMLLEKYPEEKDNLDSSYIVAQDVIALSEKINEVAEQELTKLEEAGKTTEEAKKIIDGKKSEEYYYNYGGKYFPPGYVEVSTDDETGAIDYNYDGGFVKRYDYSDKASKVDYRFGDNGYSWTTWTGEKYSTPHPTDYEPERVKRGDEVFRTDVETEDGTYNYEYYATGYKYTAPDGTEKEIVYSDSADKVQFTGGTFVDYEPTGYVVTYKGEAQVWQGNPAFDNYINLADGKVFVPEVSPQEDATYDAEKKVYEYDYGGATWAFDSATKVLTNEVTKQAIPTVAPDAPIGHEEEKELKTEDGTEWTYEENAEKFAWHWKGADGIEGDYVPAPNNYYSYDDETGNYINVKGDYDDSAWYMKEKWTMQGGAWISDSQITYDPKTGKTYVMFGDAIAEVGKDISEGELYGRKYDSSGTELNKYVYNTGSYAWDPRTNSYGFYGEAGLVNYDPANPTKHELKDAEGKVITTWVQDKDGRWRVEGSTGDTGYFGYERYSALAEIGRTVVGDDGKKYYVDSKLGWATTDENGNAYAIAPPIVGGVQQSSSATGGYGGRSYPGYYGGYYDSATGNYVGATGCSGGCYGDYGYGTNYYGGSYSSNFGQVQQSDGTWRPAVSQAEVDAAKTTGTYSASGISGYTGPTGYFDSTGKWVPPSSESYMTSGPNAWTASGTYPGGYDATTGNTGYYSGGTWVSTPSNSYGGNYANYYGSYAGSGAEVGRTTIYNGQTYTVDAVKGWTDAAGNAVAPPPGQPSSATGSYAGSYSSGGYYSTSGTWVSGGGYVNPTAGDWTGVSSGGYVSPYSTSGPNAWTASGTYSGAYTGGYYPSGGYTVGAGTYDAATGTYSYGTNTYSGGTYDPSTGSYTVSGSGTYSGGYVAPSSGGDTSTSTSTSTTSSGGDTSTSTSSGGDSGGTPTGGVISEPESNIKQSWFRNFWKRLFR